MEPASLKNVGAGGAGVVEDLPFELPEVKPWLVVQSLERQKCCHYNINC